MHVPLAELQLRRNRLLKALPPSSALIVRAAGFCTRNADNHYPFRQDSNFWYLTGLNEPNAWAVFFQNGSSLLLSEAFDPIAARWQGAYLGPKVAAEQLDFTDSDTLENRKARLSEALSGIETLYFPLGQNVSWDREILQIFRLLKAKGRKKRLAPESLHDANSILAALRMRKSPWEIMQMKKAASITAKAFASIAALMQPGCYEYEIEADILHTFAKNGARFSAYSSIVGGGNNACVLHYQANKDPLRPNTTVLVDAGCEWDYYASDVTRTFAVGGEFTPEAKAVYEVVLEAQKKAIAQIKPGARFSVLQETVVKHLSENLKSLSLPGEVGKYYMHGASHFLGLDVHDIGIYETSQGATILEPGMVVTIEPGLYLPSEDPELPKAFKGIGVRIEDDILVTEQGHENLTESIAK